INAPFDFVLGSYNDTDATLALIETHAADLAAIILEPMLGGGGCIPAELPFLQALREATERHGIVLIFDEVMTSRLSPGGLQAVLGVTPDMTTLGKYIGGGMSFGAFGGRAELMGRFDPRSPEALPHAGTFNNNALTAKGEELRGRLNAVAQRHGVKMLFTGIGSMLAVHMLAAPPRSPTEAGKGNMPARDLLFLDMQKVRIWLDRGGVLVV